MRPRIKTILIISLISIFLLATAIPAKVNADSQHIKKEKLELQVAKLKTKNTLIEKNLATQAQQLEQLKQQLADETAKREAMERASRGKRVRSPVIAISAVSNALPPEGCNSWADKTRAESDSCWGSEVAKYDWPVSIFLGFIWCESRGNTWSVNSSGHVGLLQIANGYSTKGNGPANISWAHDMYLRSGTAPWRQCGG